MKLFNRLLGPSPFGPMLDHARKVHECIKLARPLMEALVRGDHEEVHRLQDAVSRLEYEADRLKHEIRENLPSRYLGPVDRLDLDRLLHSQDDIADSIQDFAVVLMLRPTRVHPALVREFMEFVEQIEKVGERFMAVAGEIGRLAEASFRGAEARLVLERVGGIAEQEWQADRMMRRIAQHYYQLEAELDPVTIGFYEKMLSTLGSVADAVENTGDIIRQMIVKR